MKTPHNKQCEAKKCHITSNVKPRKRHITTNFKTRKRHLTIAKLKMSLLS